MSAPPARSTARRCCACRRRRSAPSCRPASRLTACTASTPCARSGHRGQLRCRKKVVASIRRSQRVATAQRDAALPRAPSRPRGRLPPRRRAASAGAGRPAVPRGIVGIRAAEAGQQAVSHQAVDVAPRERAAGRLGASATTASIRSPAKRRPGSLRAAGTAAWPPAVPGAALDEGLQLAQRRVHVVDRLQRLGQKADRAGVQRPLARFVGGDHAHRDVPGGEIGLQALEDAPAFHVGQEDVERDERGLVVARQRQRGGAAG